MKPLNKDEQVELLKSSVEEWNAYRKLHQDFVPNLYKARLREADLFKANLSNANLREASLIGAFCLQTDFRDANLYQANLSNSKLIQASLQNVDLTLANLRRADLGFSDLSKAKLKMADLIGVQLRETDLIEADFSGVRFAYSYFCNVDLSQAKGLGTTGHGGPSTIGIDTIFKSNFQIPEIFLERAGVPRQLIEYLPGFKSVPIQFYSCFISYSTKDEAFATRVYEGLKSAGIRVWYAPEEMKGGRFLMDQIDSAIRLHDKLLLVLSEESMKSDWVNTEIYKARRKEKQTGKKVLFPISIVDHEKIQNWECFDADSGRDMARDIRQFYIPDFSGWKDHDSFQVEFQKLVRDLQDSEED